MKKFLFLAAAMFFVSASISRAASINFSDNDTDCTISLTRSATFAPIPGAEMYYIVFTVDNHGADNLTIHRYSSWYIPSPPAIGITHADFELSSPQLLDIDTYDLFGIEHGPSSSRMFIGRGFVTGSQADENVDTALMLGIQYSIQSSVPTPGAVSVIGLAGIVAVRRRR